MLAGSRARPENVGAGGRGTLIVNSCDYPARLFNFTAGAFPLSDSPFLR